MMADYYFLEVAPDDEVVQQHQGTWELDGPPMPPAPMHGNVIHALTGPLAWPARPFSASRLVYADGTVAWTVTALLDDLKADAIAGTYADVDAVYEAAIGRRATEYERAEAAARAYLVATPKPTVVSGYVTGHAQSNPTGQQQTNEWAAQQIIERADAFRWAELQMRNVRFARQADMRAARTPEELAAAVGEWGDFITWLRATLGL